MKVAESALPLFTFVQSFQTLSTLHKQTNKQHFPEYFGRHSLLFLSQTSTIQGLIHLRSSVGKLIPSGSFQAFHRARQHCPVHEEETKEMKRQPLGRVGGEPPLHQEI